MILQLISDKIIVLQKFSKMIYSDKSYKSINLTQNVSIDTKLSEYNAINFDNKNKANVCITNSHL